MKIIFKIARAELRSLFQSPIAWIIIVVFFVMSGIQFVEPLMEMARVQEVKIKFSPSWGGFPNPPLTLNLFLDSIKQFLSYFYLFLPLLTMGVINREINNGTIKLLYSSPIRIIELVLGKYLGLVVFNMVLLSSIALLLTTGYYSILHSEFHWYLAMLLGFFLLSATYSAIGLYISCLTNYQLVAGIFTFVVFFILNHVGILFQDIGFIRDITYFLSISGRAETMIVGLITSRDVIYFMLIIILFLGLAILKLKTTQEPKPQPVRMARILLLLVIILGLGYVTSRPGRIVYNDVTRDQINTLDTATQRVLQEFDGSPITITLYTNLLGERVEQGIHKSRNNYVWGFWEKYIRFYPNIKLKYEYYYAVKPDDSTFYQRFPGKDIHQIAVQQAKMVGVNVRDYKKPEEFDHLKNLAGEDLSLIMELQYKERKAFLRAIVSGQSLAKESHVSGSLRRIVRDSSPLITFTTGHHERSPYRNGEREYGQHTNAKKSGNALINLGVDVDTVGLLHNAIPAATSVLAVADPKTVLTQSEQDKINRFIAEGGNAIFYGEPKKQHILNPMLNNIGVNIEDGLLVQIDKNVVPDAFRVPIAEAANYMAREEAMQTFQLFGYGGAFGYFRSMSTLSYREINGFKIEPIVKQLPDGVPTWIEKGIFMADSASPSFSVKDGDVIKPEYIIGVKLTRILNAKEQRIIVMADADFMSPLLKNGAFIGNGFYSWLLYNDYPVYTKLYNPIDNMLTIGKQTGILIYKTYVYILPGLLLLMGCVILIRRKRN